MFMPLALVSGITGKEAEPHLVKQLLYSGIVKDLEVVGTSKYFNSQDY